MALQDPRDSVEVRIFVGVWSAIDAFESADKEETKTLSDRPE